MNENKKKIAFIINPISGTQSKEQILKWLDEKLDKERYAQEVIYTERAGHAVEIAAQKAQEPLWASFPAVPATDLPATCRFRWSRKRPSTSSMTD